MGPTVVSTTEFEAQVMALIDAGKFDRAEQLIADNAVTLSEDQQTQPFESPVVYRGFNTRKINQPEGNIAVRFLTGLSRRVRNARYEQMIRDNPNRLRVLEEGDSWHQYPVYLSDLIDQSHHEFAIHSLSAPGDTLEEMLLQGEFKHAIEILDPDVFILGGSGNDLLGDGRFVRLLTPYYQGASAADLINRPVLNASLERIAQHYRQIISRGLNAKPNLKILLHGYDNVLPRRNGRWLGKPLAERGIPLDIGARIIRLIMADFSTVLAELEARWPANVCAVDLRDLVDQDPAAWQDEIHPRSDGFAKCARPILRQLRAYETDLNHSLGQPEGNRVATNGSRTHLAAALPDSIKVFPNTIPRPEASSPHSQEELAQARATVEHLLLTRHQREHPDRIAARRDYSQNSERQTYEAIIESNDLDQFYFLEQGHKVGQAVARIFARGTEFTYGTGFLIGNGLMITNNHVLKDRETALLSLATFDHQLKPDNIPMDAQHFRFTNEVFLTSEALDYTIVSVAAVSAAGVDLASYGHIPLLPRSGKVLKREHVCIIQHPDGKFKQIVVRANRVLDRKGHHLYYLSDTRPGSSGSPVFNTEWQVAALHHMAIGSSDDDTEFSANRGVRVSSILQDVANRRDDPSSDAHRIDAMLQASGPHYVPPIPPVPPVVIPNGPVSETLFQESDDWSEARDKIGEIVRLPEPEATRPKLSHTTASWPTNPQNAPDTWHLPPHLSDEDFNLTPALLRSLAQTSLFDPHIGPNGAVIFALRGCRLADGTDMAENRDFIAVTTAVVDHEIPRCLIGVWHTQDNKVSAFTGSTVPRRTEMKRYYDHANFKIGSTMCNMLPTGCYDYCVGTHYSKKNGAIKYVLRQGTGPEPSHASTVTTLRTANDLTYGTKDIWDKTKPNDNIHPGFISGSFSSQGCLTLPGRQSGGGASFSTGTGIWSRFRKRAGFAGQNHGEIYSVMLLTGHEAAAVAAAQSPQDRAALMCLRQGSQGDPVGELQHILGIKEDGKFGPATKLSLTGAQNSKLGFATGTWTPNMKVLME